LFSYSGEHVKAMREIMLRAGDDTIAGYGRYQAKLVFSLLQMQPDVCARYLIGTPFNVLEYPQAVRNLFMEDSRLAAIAYKRGKLVHGSPSNLAANDLIDSSLTAAMAQMSPDEIAALNAVENAKPVPLCSAFAKWYGYLASQPSSESAPIWRAIFESAGS
jgi:hypothetical protein